MDAWLVRAGKGGMRAPEWLDGDYIAIYWNLGGTDITKYDQAGLKELYTEFYPDASTHVVNSNVGMIYRFASKMTEGSTVVIYDPAERLYHLGQIIGPCHYVPANDNDDDNGSYRRNVEWQTEVSRDALSASAKHSLGSISTLFSVSEETLDELIAASKGQINFNDIPSDETDTTELRMTFYLDAIENIKDRIRQLVGWEDMEDLVAGVLRAMGYKTSVTTRSHDLGRDIVASPDGLGLETPRIIVEVKHRPKEKVGAPQMRSFIGGLRSTDCGLYVSTGGFKQEAKYEAERSVIPIKLLDLDQFTHLLIEYYDNTDAETRAILPLIRIYWPA